ncbi:LysR family transcriptional regulator [Mesorhizobium sp. CAU 1732]|uniref:LysR family transcriptional regulator n=1 Tax=Mesorhizobium sp. CAU 1732 TaxID=3140358 RepID=UPI0032619C19
MDAVAKRGSIRSAAEWLRIAPSAVDRQILLAEKELGVALFDRVPQGLRLTSAGEHLVYSLRRWQREFDTLRVEIDNIQGLQSGKITLAVAEAMGNDLMAALLQEFHQLYPKVTITIHVVGAGGVREMVLSGHADLGLTYMPTAYRVMRVEHSIALTPGLVVLATHELASRSEIRLRDCRELPLILPDETLRIRGSLDAALAANGVTLQAIATSNNFGLMKAMVASGLGAAVLTRAEVLSEIRSGVMRFIPFSDSELVKLSLSLVTPSHPSSATLKLSRAIVVAMDEMAG